METAVVVISAVILDRVFGEPVRGHPLIVFGRLANRIETRFWRAGANRRQGRVLGLLAMALLLLIVLLLFAPLWVFAQNLNGGETLLSIIIVYGCIAPRSLKEHALAIAGPLSRGDIDTARSKLQLIVSRDVDSASAQQIAGATCESVLENGNDGVFAALFWFVVAGVPGVLVYRMVNTLDAMWGYRCDRYKHFGWAAARFDDWLNWLPARLVSISYALMGNFDTAIRCWRRQAQHWKSSNAGAVMAAGAGSLQIGLGGQAYYHGQLQQRPVLGQGRQAKTADIYRALALVDRTLLLWLLIIVTAT